MKTPFPIWTDVANFGKASSTLRAASKERGKRMLIQVKEGRLRFTSGSATFDIACECAQEFSATTSVTATRRLLKLPKPSPEMNGRILLAVRPMDKQITTEWAAAKVKFLSFG